MAQFIGAKFVTLHGRPPRPSGLSALDRLRQEFSDGRFYFNHHPEMLLVMQEFALRGKRDPEVQKTVDQMNAHWRDGIERMVRAGVADGTFRDDIPPSEMLSMLMSIFAGAATSGTAQIDAIERNTESWILSANAKKRLQKPTGAKKMKNHAFQVAIIGGGMGGLCLANGLKKAGISVTVYERDQSPESRPQGYRIHIDPQGSTALHECLPPHLWDLFSSTGGDFSRGFSIVTQQLDELLNLARLASKQRRYRGPLPGIDRSAASPCVASCWPAWNMTCNSTSDFCAMKKLPRAPSARILKTAAAPRQICSWLRTASIPPFANSTCPMPNLSDTGVVGIGGTIPLTDGVMALAPHMLLDGPAHGRTARPLQHVHGHVEAFGRGRPRRCAALGIEGPLPGDEDYLILAIGGRPDFFGLDQPACIRDRPRVKRCLASRRGRLAPQSPQARRNDR